MTRNAINWFEIPVADIDRAQRFYETLLARSLRRETGGPAGAGRLPVRSRRGRRRHAEAGRRRARARHANGTLVYLDASPSLDVVLSRAGELGARGAAAQDWSCRAAIGFIAHILDSEGNRIGLHSLHA